MEGEPANEEKLCDEEWPLDKAEVSIYIADWIFFQRLFGMMQEEIRGNKRFKKWEITVELVLKIH